jgi:L-ascorbate metabolism protein UlaG (beta-lactamase superfamily)
MEIFWLGHGCFRLRGRDATVLTNPAPPSTGYKIGRVAADIVLISRNHPDDNYRAALSGTPTYIDGPGEYEIAGVLIGGVRTDPPSIERKLRNVAFVFDIDDVRVCFLGDIARPPGRDEVEALGSADVLILPVGGGSVLNAASAAETVSLLEPKIVLPMQYKTEAATGQLDSVDRFLKEMNTEAKAPEARLTVTRSSVPADTSVVLLNYRG